jgi:hypothetical protein
VVHIYTVEDRLILLLNIPEIIRGNIRIEFTQIVTLKSKVNWKY